MNMKIKILLEFFLSHVLHGTADSVDEIFILDLVSLLHEWLLQEAGHRAATQLLYI